MAEQPKLLHRPLPPKLSTPRENVDKGKLPGQFLWCIVTNALCSLKLTQKKIGWQSPPTREKQCETAA